MTVKVRPATEGDLPTLTRLDLTYPTDRFLALERPGDSPEYTFTLRWRNRVPAPMATYATYTLEGLREALQRTDLFLVAQLDREVAGLLMIIVPSWTDAAEITDLAVDIAFRRLGGGRAPWSTPPSNGRASTDIAPSGWSPARTTTPRSPSTPRSASASPGSTTACTPTPTTQTAA
jgi:hypothetical protein